MYPLLPAHCLKQSAFVISSNNRWLSNKHCILISANPLGIYNETVPPFKRQCTFGYPD